MSRSQVCNQKFTRIKLRRDYLEVIRLPAKIGVARGYEDNNMLFIRLPGFSDNCQERKTSPDPATEHVRAAQSVLSTARSKLAIPLYTGHRPYVPNLSSHSLAPPSSAYPLASATVLAGGVEHDISLQDELEFRFDRSSFRSLEPRVRSRHLPGYGSYLGSSSGSSSSSHHHPRSTYFRY